MIICIHRDASQRCTQSMLPDSVHLFLDLNKEFYSHEWFFSRKSNSVVLPDVVATLSSEENIQEDQSQSQEKIFLEKLEEENLRLKAIFKLHSIKINARDEGERRRSSTDSARHSSVSSESSHEQTDCKVKSSWTFTQKLPALVTHSDS